VMLFPERVDDRVDALAGNGQADTHDEPRPSAFGDGATRGERREVHAARGDGDSASRNPERREFEGLVGAGRHDSVGFPTDAWFQPPALDRARIVGPLVAALADAEGVEGM